MFRDQLHFGEFPTTFFFFFFFPLLPNQCMIVLLQPSTQTLYSFLGNVAFGESVVVLAPSSWQYEVIRPLPSLCTRSQGVASFLKQQMYGSSDNFLRPAGEIILPFFFFFLFFFWSHSALVLFSYLHDILGVCFVTSFRHTGFYTGLL